MPRDLRNQRIATVTIALLVAAAAGGVAFHFLAVSHPQTESSPVIQLIICTNRGGLGGCVSQGTCASGSTQLNTVGVGISNVSRTVTTANVSLSLTPSGSSSATPPGSVSQASNGTCSVALSAGNWYALLIPPGGPPPVAIYSEAGWQLCENGTDPCAGLTVLPSPWAFTVGETIVVVGAPSVTLNNALLSIQSTSDSSILGSVTL